MGSRVVIQWSDAYRIGNARIDAEHQIFLGLIADFQSQRLQSAPQERLNRILQEVLKYAEFHFLSEENLMIDCGYPGLTEHRLHHMHLLSRAGVKLHEMELGLCTPEEVEAFLLDWFLTHTRSEDQKIVEYLQASGPAAG